MLRYLDERGIALGCDLEIADRQPFGGPITIDVGGTSHVLGGRLAQAMRVELRAGPK
jgi:DtxR family Mn-dependent transcriptional regulator